MSQGRGPIPLGQQFRTIKNYDLITKLIPNNYRSNRILIIFEHTKHGRNEQQRNRDRKLFH